MVNNIVDYNNQKIYLKKNKLNEIEKNKEMNFLKEKMSQVGLSQKELANRLDRNVVTINRWFNEERQITPVNAIEIAKILKCDPAAILFPPKKLNTIELHYYTDDSYMVKDLTKKYYSKIVIPNGYYTKTTLAVKFYKIGSEKHNEIMLFESVTTENNYEGFHEDSIGKICYIELDKKKIKIGFTQIIAIVKINESTPNYTLDLINPKTNNLINKKLVGINPEYIKISAPLKMCFFEKYNYNI